jgi:hypothetical protein
MSGDDVSFLKGKRCLIISPVFFGYEKEIKRAIERAGGVASIIDERPGNGFWTKAIIRLRSSVISGHIERYYDSCISSLAPTESFDYVLVISPEAINAKVLAKLHDRFPSARFVLYMFDSLRNKTGSNIEALFPQFDRILSFDPEDCNAHPMMKMRPLFYTDEYSTIATQGEEYRYDIAFIGTLHSDRFSIGKEIADIAAQHNMRYFSYYYMIDRRLYLAQKVLNRHMRDCRMSDVSFIPMPKEKVLEVIKGARIILDIQHPTQSGLTMRTIEAFGAGRKLITTNQRIREYDFYDKSNISIVERENIRIDEDFIGAHYVSPRPDVYKRYSINGWLSEVLG